MKLSNEKEFKSLFDYNLGFKEALARFFEQVANNFSKVLEEFSSKTEWILDPGMFMNTKVLNSVLFYLNSNNIHKAEKLYRRYMLKYYTLERINEIEKIWTANPTLNNRINILKQVLDAHNNGMYFVSVPTILCQIEGYVYHSFNYNEHLRQRALINLIKDKNNFLIYAESIGKYCEKVIYTSFRPEQPIESKISRNAILHGFDLNYGTKEISLKLIILMNVMQYLIPLTIHEENKNVSSVEIVTEKYK
ncbi:hypothetical protein AB4Z30_13585 [Paenibacillus sp. 2TAF8]|uniref:hypothetical protein n=1 Tax=Paenibacillus sp. 2TAF8 TaxID=3233020 RepID=UPI003F9A574A